MISKAVDSYQRYIHTQNSPQSNQNASKYEYVRVCTNVCLNTNTGIQQYSFIHTCTYVRMYVCTAKVHQTQYYFHLNKKLYGLSMYVYTIPLTENIMYAYVRTYVCVYTYIGTYAYIRTYVEGSLQCNNVYDPTVHIAPVCTYACTHMYLKRPQALTLVMSPCICTTPGMGDMAWRSTATILTSLLSCCSALEWGGEVLMKIQSGQKSCMWKWLCYVVTTDYGLLRLRIE